MTLEWECGDCNNLKYWVAGNYEINSTPDNKFNLWEGMTFIKEYPTREEAEFEARERSEK